MSIAVSAVIRPSRVALGMIGTISISTILIGISVATGYVGELSFAVRNVIALALTAASFFAIYSSRQFIKTHHIDISGIGQIRLVEDSALVTSTFLGAKLHRLQAGEVLSMMEDSTLWSFLLLLRLKGEGSQVRTLIVLRDSVDADAFRALSVACRWIALHGNPDSHRLHENVES